MQTLGSKESQLREQIAGLVADYYHERHAPRAFVPGKSRVPYAGRVFDEREVQSAVGASLDFWLTLGPEGAAFESKVAELFGARKFLLVNSGSSANLLATSTLTSHTIPNPMKRGDEVITPAVTFPTTLTPLLQNGFIPVFVDVEMGVYNVDPAKLEAAISPKTRAIMIPHTLGNPCEMDVVTSLARKHSLYLIEDTCDAFGSRYDGRLVGSFGDMATLSFYPAHHITMGEGGGVIVNNPRMQKAALSIRDWGRDCWCDPGVANTCGKRFDWQLGDLPQGYDHKYIYSHLGYNLKPTDLQAAIGLAQLEKLDGFVAARRKNFARLYEGLKRHEELVLPRWYPKSEPAWFGFPITVRPPMKRIDIVHWLENGLIETRQVFAGNVLRQPAFRNIEHRIAGPLVETDAVMDRTFFIGVYPGLTDEMIDYVIDRFDKFFAGRKETAHV